MIPSPTSSICHPHKVINTTEVIYITTVTVMLVTSFEYFEYARRKYSWTNIVGKQNG